MVGWLVNDSNGIFSNEEHMRPLFMSRSSVEHRTSEWALNKQIVSKSISVSQSVQLRQGRIQCN